MTAKQATARARVLWSEYPTVRNVGFIGLLLVGAAAYGGEVQEIRATPARVDRVEARQDRDGRKIAFTACRMADSTINQCLHHYSEP